MSLTNLSKEELYLKCATLKNEFALWGKSQKYPKSERSVADVGHDVITVCNELIGLIDQLPLLEKSVRCMELVKEFRNFAANI